MKKSPSKLVIDSSVVAKWFKSGEEFEKEGLRLRDDLLSSSVTALASELMQLEVCRALVKARYPTEKVEETYAALNEMHDLGFIKSVPIEKLDDEAKDLVIRLNLYVADSLVLAAAVVTSSDLLTEDRHLLKEEVKKMMRGKGLEVVRLRELYHK